MDEATTTAPAAAPAADAPRTRTPAVSDYATLKRGSNYALKFEGQIYRWSKDEEKRVSAKLRAHLEETAKDTVTVDHGDGGKTNETRPKFSFDRR